MRGGTLKRAATKFRTGFIGLGFLGLLAVQIGFALTLTLGSSPSAWAQNAACDSDEPDNDSDDQDLLSGASYCQPNTGKSLGGYTPDTNLPPDCQCDKLSGNPIDNTTGNKYQVEQDYSGAGPFPLKLIRHYNSLAGGSASAFGSNWSHEFGGHIQQVSATLVNVVKGDNKVLSFYLTSGAWKPNADVNSRLTQLSSGQGWQYTTGVDSVETYNASGKLTSVTNRAGLTQTLVYDPQERLSQVTDPFGRKLNFTYDAQNRITGMTDPAGGAYVYAYDGNNNLVSVRYPDGTTRGYVYENTAFPHALTGIIDENGVRFATWVYNASGLAISSEHAGGVDKVTLSYDFTTGVTTVTDALGSKTAYSYGASFGAARPVSVTRPTTAPNNRSYDANGNVKTYVDNKGTVATYIYDLNRNLETSHQLSPISPTVTTTWHSTFRLPTGISDPFRGSFFSYDAKGNLLIKTVSGLIGPFTYNTRTWTYTYNSSGQVLTVDGPRSDVQDVATFTYDAQGNLATIKNALGHVTSITRYDVHGRPLSVTDPNGLVTTLAYDARGRLTSRDVGGEATSYAYDAVGNLVKITVPDGSFLAYSYDAAHRLIGISDRLGNRIAYTLNAVGKRVKEEVFDPANTLTRTHARSFDVLNRLAKDIGAQNQTTMFSYDANNNLLSITDPLSNTTQYSYDTLNNLYAITDPMKGSSRFTYNINDQVIGAGDPRGASTTYAYDGLDGVTSVSSPDSGTTSNTYDAAGKLRTSTDARGQKTTYTYDALNRVIQTGYSDGKISTYAYDQGTNGLGRLSSITDSSGATSWIYDVHGRVVRKQQIISVPIPNLNPLVLNINYGYDLQGRLIKITYPSGRQIGYGYDTAGRVNAVTVDGQSLLSGIGYQPFGAPAGWTWSNGSTYSRTFDLDGWVTSFSLGADIRTLTYDAAGRITSVSDRVTLQSPNLPSESTQYAVSPGSNKLLSQTGLAPATYSYDAAGNLTRDGNLTGDGNRIYAYDARGRLSSATVTTVVGGIIVRSSTDSYAINELGQRILKGGSHSVIAFAYDEAGQLLGEYDLNGNVIQETIWFGGAPVALVKPSGRFFVFADQLGTPRVVTTQSLRTVWSWNSDPFGRGAPAEGVDDTGARFTYNLRFPGQYFDAETGLHYNYMRDYDPSAGRYIQSDPIGLRGGINTYAYVRGNPINLMDPLGLEETSAPSDETGVKPEESWDSRATAWAEQAWSKFKTWGKLIPAATKLYFNTSGEALQQISGTTIGSAISRAGGAITNVGIGALDPVVATGVASKVEDSQPCDPHKGLGYVGSNKTKLIQAYDSIDGTGYPNSPITPNPPISLSNP